MWSAPFAKNWLSCKIQQIFSNTSRLPTRCPQVFSSLANIQDAMNTIENSIHFDAIGISAMDLLYITNRILIAVILVIAKTNLASYDLLWYSLYVYIPLNIYFTTITGIADMELDSDLSTTAVVASNLIQDGIHIFSNQSQLSVIRWFIYFDR